MFSGRIKILRTMLLVSLLTTGVYPSYAIGLLIDASDSGWYTNTGTHDPNNTNYTVGCCVDLSTFRNFFVFDVPPLSGPVDYAELRIFVSQYNDTDDPSETYQLFDVQAPVLQVTSGGGVSVFNDLGVADLFASALGSAVVTAADEGRVIVVPLNQSGLTYLASGGGLVAFGGSIDSTLSFTGGEKVFGGSGLGLGTQQLFIHAVPEPTSMIFIALGLLTLIVSNRSRRAWLQDHVSRLFS